MSDAITLIGAQDGTVASLVGLYGHMICCSGRKACSSSGGVGCSCWMQRSQQQCAR